MLARRLFSHIWHVIDLVAKDHPAHFVELVYAFFPHVIGFHRWNVNVKLLDLVPAEPSTKFSRIAEIKRMKFEIVTTCPHDKLDNFATPPVPVNSPPLQLLLELLGKNAFISDIRKVYSKCATSALESFHSIRIRYCPKRRFFALRGLTVKTMLATMHWNTTRLAERKAVTMYESFSKARGRNRLVTRKEVAEQGWKRKIVEKAVDRKLQYGPGHQMKMM
uniref:Uncharacterized protein n=1 Tax=Ditylenchus dipsaci TaxID=166011 RepID=A0A915E9B9_9BILA